MMGDRYFDVYSRTLAKDAEGNMVPTYAYLKTIKGNLQPSSKKTITPDVSKPFGYSQEPMKWHLLFAPDPSILDLYRVKDGANWYDIRGIDQWPTYYGAQLVPVQGGM